MHQSIVSVLVELVETNRDGVFAFDMLGERVGQGRMGA